MGYKKQIAKGLGNIRKVEALAPANEEHGRLTLHSHWQCWTKELSQKLCDQLFDNDEEKKADARKNSHSSLIISNTLAMVLIW